ncbi:hypothetical protein [Burkholderia gladioli]|uniref:hypothetical protein n=2 Tax=Burkholderia gladioli TaxID=28095 RepID=UPI00163EEF1F|nr:hypothetical protein [Burkholderia gladioli]MDN7460316.1 hypothetical protein [Burkholderia gladioli]MDN7752065.1 hypothetical protein [Burkholderia gladioli]
MAQLGDSQEGAQQFQFHSAWLSNRSKHSFYGSIAAAFNTGSCCLEGFAMCARHFDSCLTGTHAEPREPEPGRDGATGTELGSQCAPTESTVGKRARARFVEPLGEAAPRAATGSIAVSLAIVSFRNWPRRGL